MYHHFKSSFFHILLICLIYSNITLSDNYLTGEWGQLRHIPFSHKIEPQKILKKISNSHNRKKLSELLNQEEESYKYYSYFSTDEICWADGYYSHMYGPYLVYMDRGKAESRLSVFTNLKNQPLFAIIQEPGTYIDYDQIRFPVDSLGGAFETPRLKKQFSLKIRTHENIRNFNKELLKLYEALSITKILTTPIPKGSYQHDKERWFHVRHLPKILTERYDAIQKAESELDEVYAKVLAYIGERNESSMNASEDEKMKIKIMRLNNIQKPQEAWQLYRTAHINLLHELLPQKYKKDLWKRFVLMTIARKNFWQQWLNFNLSFDSEVKRKYPDQV